MAYLEQLKKISEGPCTLPKEQKQFADIHCLGFLGTRPGAFHKEDGLPDALLQMLDGCLAAGLYDANERALLVRLFDDDEAGVASLIEDMHARIDRCRTCQHFRRPGLSEGYCVTRGDLPAAYGLLREQPADRGAWCSAFEVARAWR